jgi:serine/threonine protein kinase
VGEGIPLQGELLRLVSNHSPVQSPVADHQDPAREFEVVGKLGTGSYAIVYLVREVLSRSPPSEDGHVYAGGPLELDDSVPTEYGRNYAIKLLSKVNLDEEEQRAEVRSPLSFQLLSTPEKLFFRSFLSRAH